MLQRIIDVVTTARFVACELALVAWGRLRTMNRVLFAVLVFSVLSLLTLSVVSPLFRKRPDAWREELPTPEQIRYAGELGITVTDGVTRGELAEKIQQGKASRRDEN